MINTQEYTDKLRDHFDNMIPLDEPEDTHETSYCTFTVLDFEDFDTLFWEPALKALKQKIKGNAYYTLEVFTRGNTICLLFSLGNVGNPLT